MSRVCDVCGKKAQNGNNVSHANNKTKKLWQPNLQSVRHQTGSSVKTLRVCTKCIKSGAVVKPSPRPQITKAVPAVKITKTTKSAT